jgi:hypothetical protein
LVLFLEGEKRAILSRTFAGGERRFVPWRGWTNAAGKLQTQSQVVPTTAQIGRLRLVRTGTLLSYFASEGLDQEFIPLQQYEVGDENVKEIRLAGTTGGLQAALEARVANLRLRTGSVPALLPANASPGFRPRWIVLALAVGLLLAFALGIAMALRRHRRRGRNAAEAATDLV